MRYMRICLFINTLLLQASRPCFFRSKKLHFCIFVSYSKKGEVFGPNVGPAFWHFDTERLRWDWTEGIDGIRHGSFLEDVDQFDAEFFREASQTHL